MSDGRRGFVLVEVLIAILVLSILAAVVVMIVSPSDNKNAAKQCISDALTFQDAVHVAHERSAAKKWPDEQANSVEAVALALALEAGYTGDAQRHLDGSQRRPVTAYKGWKYNFATHTVDTTNCGA